VVNSGTFADQDDHGYFDNGNGGGFTDTDLGT